MKSLGHPTASSSIHSPHGVHRGGELQAPETSLILLPPFARSNLRPQVPVTMKCLIFILIFISSINFLCAIESNTTIAKVPRNHKAKNAQRRRPTASASPSNLPLWFNGYPKPVWISDPTPQIVTKGSSVSLSCSCLTQTPFTLLWKKDGVPLDLVTSKNYQSLQEEPFIGTSSTEDTSGGQNPPLAWPSGMVKFTSSLHLVDLEEDDQGVYQCVGTNDKGTVPSLKARITIHSVPSFIKTPSNITTRVGSTVRLECAAKGTPSPVISWTKDGGHHFPAASERRMHVLPTENTFFLVDVKVTDMGIYSCRARNPAGESVANSTLTVIENPHFIRPMADVKKTEMDTAVIECAASASPPPKFLWTKDGYPVKLTERHFLTANQQLLVIMKVLQSDSGVYGCHVSNELGSVEQSMLLSITPDSYKVSSILSISTAILIILCILISIGLIYLWAKVPKSSSPPPSPVPRSTSLTEQTDLSITPDIAHYTTIDAPDDFDDSYIDDSHTQIPSEKKANVSL